jgi:hypothetical protein
MTSPNPQSQRWRWVILIVIVAAVLTVTVLKPTQREDCRHSWTGAPRPDDQSQPIEQIAVSDLVTNIPEFHDCQKFINAAGNGYGDQPLAIFAHYSLLGQFEKVIRRWSDANAAGVWSAQSTITITPGWDAQRVSDFTSRLNNPTGAGDAFVFAEILNYGDEYPSLGIKHGFNCLYVALKEQTTGTQPPIQGGGGVQTSSTQPQTRGPRISASQPSVLVDLTAIMVSVPQDGICLQAARFDTLRAKGAKVLAVRPTAVGRQQDDFPPVARWDWDGLHHFIGIMCGPAWCEIGEPGFNSSPSYPGDKTHVVKGWYDEQRLAIKNADGMLVPSPVVGTVFPTPGLLAVRDTGSAAISRFTGSWVDVASVALSQASPNYKEKLNLDPSPPTEARNVIALCNGWATCAPRVRIPLFGGGLNVSAVWRLPVCASSDNGTWRARITGAAGNVSYRCVRRWAAPTNATFYVPATARWRWLVDDEGTWEGCIQGCCETKPST